MAKFQNIFCKFYRIGSLSHSPFQKIRLFILQSTLRNGAGFGRPDPHFRRPCHPMPGRGRPPHPSAHGHLHKK